MKVLFIAVALSVAASAADSANPEAMPDAPAIVSEPAPAVVDPAPAATVVEEAKPIPAAPPALAAPKTEPIAELKPEPKAPVAVKAPELVKNLGPEEEWAFVKSAAEDPDAAVQDAAIDELNLFARRFPDAPQAAEALSALASLRAKKGDWPAALAIYLRAKSSYLELVDKKASRKQRQALNDLASTIESAAKADRLSDLWQRAALMAPDSFYEPLADEIRSFSARYPLHAEGDKLQAALARVHAANAKPAAAALAWRKLLALYPASPLRPIALKSLGDLYADALRDPKKAIDAYQDLIANYPQAPEVLAAYESSARLFEEKLKQYDLSVDMHEKIVKGFPKTAGSLKSLKAIARLQRERLAKPDAAIKTLQRLSAMHAGQDGVDALLLAADVARKDMKNYKAEAELRQQIAADYPAAKETPEALYDAAVVYEEDVKDGGKALETYREVQSKFPNDKYGKKAISRADKLAAVK